MSETLGDRLTRYMKLGKLKNPDVAAVTGADATTVSKWRSDVQAPSENKLAAIVELLRKRGVSTTAHELRHGRDDDTRVPVTYGFGEIDFESVTAKQRARVSLEGTLLKFAERGADDRFLAAARRFLLNPANYDPALSAGAMDDEAKIRHMQSLAIGLQVALHGAHPPSSTAEREAREEFERDTAELLGQHARPQRRRAAGGSRKRP